MVIAEDLRLFGGKFHGRLEPGFVVTWLSQHHEEKTSTLQEEREAADIHQRLQR